MGNLFDLLYQRRHILIGHILHDHEGEAAFSEFIQQLLLSLHGVHGLRQVIQHVIVDSGPDHADHGRDHQQQRDDQDGDFVLYDCF